MTPADDNNNDDQPRIILAHGGGGELTRRLIERHVLPRLGNELLDPLLDSAVLPRPGGRLCMTTDAFVVQPLEFPGGDIGSLSVCGTVNDLSVCGARPTALSLALVIEEGLLIATLERVLDSIAASAERAGVVVATGDTKVIERSSGQGLIITTAGVGELREDVNLAASRIQAGDAIIVSGRIAEHGLAVMSAREGLGIQSDLLSDAAPLNGLVHAIFDSGADVKFMRDPTRGGLAGVLADLLEETNLTLEVREQDIPISLAALSTAELLGLDPLTIANEGKVLAVVAGDDANVNVEKALAACRNHPLGRDAAVVGRFAEADTPLVELITRAGGRRIINRPYGEELPRIC